MKTSMIGVVSAAILLVVAGVGSGIVQAAATHSEQHGSSIEDQGITQVATSPQEFVSEGNWSGTDWQAGGPVEPGTIPVTVLEESWMKDYGND